MKNNKNKKVTYSILGISILSLFVLRATEGDLLRALSPFIIIPLAIGILFLKDKLLKK